MADNGLTLMAGRKPDNGTLTQKPPTGEQTGAQTTSTAATDALSLPIHVPSFGSAPPGTVGTYRRMRRNPVVSIGRMAVQAPVKAAEWSLETTEDAPADAEELIERWVVKARPLIVKEAIRMLDYGSQSFELVWESRGGAQVPTKYKPLLPDLTRVQVEKETGAFGGLKNRGQSLPPEKALHFAWDLEGANWYGRSLFENIRESAWWPWEQTLHREGQTTTKAAGVTLAVGYVPGQGRDASGAEQDNYELAKKLLHQFGSGRGLLWPKQLVPWAERVLENNPSIDPNKLASWSLDFMEPGTGHVDEMISAMRHKEQLMLRGLMVPERAVTEGQFGTKAESETQAGIVMAFAEEVLQEIVRCVNWYVIDRILALNFGEAAVGSVFITPEPLVDEKAKLVRELVKGVLGQPANADLWQALTDVDAQLDMVGLPRPEESERPEVPATPDEGDGAVEDDDAGGDMEAQIRGIYQRANRSVELQSDGFTPPKGVQQEAAKGLRWRRIHGRGGTEVGVARARDLSNGSAVSADTIQRMVSFFARHEVDKEAEGFRPGEDGFPSNGRIAWALWGGDPGKRWAERINKRLERES